MRPQNPIEQRLSLLYTQWDDFAGDAKARVLRWLIRADERRMLEAFLTIEDDEVGELGALFFVFTNSFAKRRYGHELCGGLDRQLREMETQLVALGLPRWTGAVVEGTVSDIGSLMQTCAAVSRVFGELVETVVLVLWPEVVEDPPAFVDWLRRAARVMPDRVRVVVVDRIEAPLLDALDGELVRSVEAGLDVPAAITELAAAAPGRTSPGGRFRDAFVGMSSALAHRDLEAAREHANAALHIAREAGFDHLEVAVPFALGTGLLGEGDIEGAIEQLRAAAQRAVSLGIDGAANLRVKSHLGLAAALFGAQAWSHAAREYATAGEWAGALDDRCTQVDALRMSAWAFECGGELDDAWAMGLAGLNVAEGLPKEDLQRSTVPWLGELLLRLSNDGARFERERMSVAPRLARLLGSGWRRR